MQYPDSSGVPQTGLLLTTRLITRSSISLKLAHQVAEPGAGYFFPFKATPLNEFLQGFICFEGLSLRVEKQM